MKFIASHQQILNPYAQDFDPVLITLSILIAIAASFTAFGVVERINKTEKPFLQTIWMFFGAISMGLGFWAMHFIGSLALALSLPVPVSFNLKLMLLSMIPAILVSYVVLWLLMQSRFNSIRLLLCGSFLGLGICNMHFLGMLSLQFNGKVVYAPNLLIVAVIIALIFSIIALYIQFEAASKQADSVVGLKQLKGSVAMGFAVFGMYYTITFATVFIPWQTNIAYDQSIDTTMLAYIIALVIMLILILAVMIPMALRYRQMSFSLAQHEEELRIAAIAFQAQDAIMITDENTNIISVNEAFTEITGYSEQESLGQTPKLLQSGKHNKLYFKELWDTLIKEQQWCGEIWNKRKNGELFPCWQSISTVKHSKGQKICYVSFFSDISKFKKNARDIERLVFYDALTDLPNRRLLKDHLEHEFSTAKRYQRNGALLFLDLDNFKQINDTLGHSVGDEILIKTAERLLSILRKSDIPVRLGGDEYIILIPAQNKFAHEIASQAQSVAEKIIKHINRPFHVNDKDLLLTTSIGITLFSGDEDDPDTIIKQADTAMYQAKKGGRNTFKFYHESMQQQADKRLSMEKYLRVACANKELELYYQAQFSENREIIGVEALVRWHHPDLGLILPGDFIPVAEESGLIFEIGEWIIATACDQIKQWDEQGIVIPYIAINISAREFHQENFSEMLKTTIMNAGVQPQRFLFETTENVFLKTFDATNAIMNDLNKSGFRFSIDDFGTGYASLSFLKRLPYDQIKIDQSFVHDLSGDPDATASTIVKAIIALAKSMNITLIAEGVETEIQFKQLTQYGCHEFQGYFFSQPISSSSFSTFYQQHKSKKDS